MLELLEMWALLEALGLIFLPLTATVFHNLPDRGWAFSKAIGLAVLAFCVWLPLMCLQFLPFSQLFIFGVLLVLIVLNALLFWRMRDTVWKIIRTHTAYILVAELIFLGMIVLLGVLRSYSPDIRSYEMFMDEGFLSAIMRSPHLPPNDMWYAGQPINYYYYAHYNIAMLAKLLGQSPSLAFNTGICSFFGLTAINLFGVTTNIVAWARYQRRQRQQGASLASDSLRSGRPLPSMLGAVPYGLLTMLFGLVLGNLAATQVWWQNHGSLPDFYWFNASRVINNTINEFPAFSFLLSCFHAHVLALAFTILGIGLIFNLFLEQKGQGLRAFGRGWRLPLTMGVTALVLGSLYAMNGWDYPTYLALAIVCLILQQWMSHQARFNLDLVLDIFTVCASLGVLSFFLFAPFYMNFVSPAQGLGLVGPNDRTPLINELEIYGVFAFIFLTLLIVHFFRKLPRARLARTAQASLSAVTLEASGEIERPMSAGPDTAEEELFVQEARTQGAASVISSSDVVQSVQEDDEPAAEEVHEEELQEKQEKETETSGLSIESLDWREPRFLGLIITLLVGIAVLLLLKNSVTFVVTGALAAIGGILVLCHLRARERSFVLLLGATACALVAFCEVVFLRDVFADSLPRMNTVFKFYFQAWALLSIAGGAGVYFVLEALSPALTLPSFSRSAYRISQVIWSIALLALLLASAVYPLTAPAQRFDHFSQRSSSLDGLAYMSTYDKPDYEAIQWINSTIQGAPVIVEAIGTDYSDYGRISSFTGLPTLMSWEGHEWQWRVNWVKPPENGADFFRRPDDIKKIYTDPSSQNVLTIMAYYHAQYIYVGPLEQTTYVGADLQRFSSFMRTVYQRDGVTIYQVP